MTANGFAFRNPVRDAGDFRYVMVAGPDELLIEPLLDEARHHLQFFRVFERGGRNIVNVFPETGLPNSLGQIQRTSDCPDANHTTISDSL